MGNGLCLLFSADINKPRQALLDGSYDWTMDSSRTSPLRRVSMKPMPAIRDYYLLPALDMTWERLRLAEDNGVYLDTYQFDALDYFYGMAEHCKIERAA